MVEFLKDYLGPALVQSGVVLLFLKLFSEFLLSQQTERIKAETAREHERFRAELQTQLDQHRAALEIRSGRHRAAAAIVDAQIINGVQEIDRALAALANATFVFSHGIGAIDRGNVDAVLSALCDATDACTGAMAAVDRHRLAIDEPSLVSIILHLVAVAGRLGGCSVELLRLKIAGDVPKEAIAACLENLTAELGGVRPTSIEIYAVLRQVLSSVLEPKPVETPKLNDA